MICPNCDCLMDAMGYGDERCPKCDHISWNDFEEHCNICDTVLDDEDQCPECDA